MSHLRVGLLLLFLLSLLSLGQVFGRRAQPSALSLSVKWSDKRQGVMRGRAALSMGMEAEGSSLERAASDSTGVGTRGGGRTAWDPRIPPAKAIEGGGEGQVEEEEGKGGGGAVSFDKGRACKGGGGGGGQGDRDAPVVCSAITAVSAPRRTSLDRY